MLYKVGEPFPDDRFNSHPEGAVITFNEHSFDVIGLLDRPSTQEVKTWKTGKLYYGLFQQDDVPFLLLDFRYPIKFNLDAPVNAYKITEPIVWSFGEGNLVTLFLVDRRNYRLMAMRSIGIELTMAQSLRQVMRNQVENYPDQAVVDGKISLLLNRVPTEEMIANSSMHKAGQ